MYNPSDACKLPRVERKEIQTFNDEQIKQFLVAVEGHRFATLYKVTLLAGIREGEVMGLQWYCVDIGAPNARFHDLWALLRRCSQSKRRRY